MIHRAAGWSALLLSLSACSPAYNWRELRPYGTPLLALMPCKPETASRPVPLGATPTVLHMHSCEAGGLRFAVAWTDVGHAAQVEPAMAAWRAATLQTLRVMSNDDQHAWAVQVAGADTVQGLQVQGTDPSGRTVHARSVYFADNTQVFQAAVYGEQLPDEVMEAFFAGLRLVPR